MVHGSNDPVGEEEEEEEEESAEWVGEVESIVQSLVAHILTCAIPDDSVLEEMDNKAEHVWDVLVQDTLWEIAVESLHESIRAHVHAVQAEAGAGRVARRKMEEKIVQLKAVREEHEDDLSFLQTLSLLQDEVGSMVKEERVVDDRLNLAKQQLQVSWRSCSGIERNAAARLLASLRFLLVVRTQNFASALSLRRLIQSQAGNKRDCIHVFDWKLHHVSTFLQSCVRLPQYISSFLKGGVDGGLLLEVDDQDLVLLGVRSTAHRQEILVAIRMLALEFSRFQVPSTEAGSERSREFATTWSLTLAPALFTVYERVQSERLSVRASALESIYVRLLTLGFSKRFHAHLQGLAFVIQRGFRQHKARRAYTQLWAQRDCQMICDEVAMDLSHQIAAEERAIYFAWVRSVASEAAHTLQAYARGRLAPSIPETAMRMALEDSAANVIQRSFRAVQVRRKLILKGVAFFCVDGVLFGTAMNSAEREVQTTIATQIAQSFVRRTAAMRALCGHLTSISLVLAERWCFEDMIQNFLEDFDEIYQEPLARAARTVLTCALLMSPKRRPYLARLDASYLLQARLRSNKEENLEYRRHVVAMRVISGLAHTKRRRRDFLALFTSIVWFQHKSRELILIRSARRFKWIVNCLVSRARACLYRKLYIHVLTIGDQLISADARLRYLSRVSHTVVDTLDVDTLSSGRGHTPQGTSQKERPGSRQSTDHVPSILGTSRPGTAGHPRPSTVGSSSRPVTSLSSKSQDAWINSTAPVSSALSAASARFPSPFCVQSFVSQFLRRGMQFVLSRQQPGDRSEGSEDADSEAAAHYPEFGGAPDAQEAGGEEVAVWDPADCSRLLEYLQSEEDVVSDEYRAACVWLREQRSALLEEMDKVPWPSVLVFPVQRFLVHAGALSWLHHPGVITHDLKKAGSLFSVFMSLISAIAEVQAHEDISTCLSELKLCCEALLHERGYSQYRLQNQKPRSLIDSLEEHNPARSASIIAAWIQERQACLCDLHFREPFPISSPVFWAKLGLDLADYCLDKGHIHPVPCFSRSEKGQVELMAANSGTAIVQALAESACVFILDYFTPPEVPYQHIIEPLTLNDAVGISNSSKVDNMGNKIPVESADALSSALHWSFSVTEKLSCMFISWISQIYPLGFLGANSTRKRRSNLLLWAHAAVERCLSQILVCLLRASTTAETSKACQLLAILSLTPGRTTLLSAYGIVGELVEWTASSGTDTPLHKAASFALQSFVADTAVALRISLADAIWLARKLDHRSRGKSQYYLLKSIQIVLEVRGMYAEHLFKVDSLVPKLLSFLQRNEGKDIICAVAADILCISCPDAPALDVLGDAQDILASVSAMVRSGQNVCEEAALKLLVKLAVNAQNICAMYECPNLLEAILENFRQQRSQFLHYCCNIMTGVAREPCVALHIFQAPNILRCVFKMCRSGEGGAKEIAFDLVVAMCCCVETAQDRIDDATEPAAVSNQLRACSEQINQIGSNEHFLDTIFLALSHGDKRLCLCAIRIISSVARCSEWGRSCMLRSRAMLDAIVTGMKHASPEVKRWSVRTVYYFSLDCANARVLLDAGALVQLRVLVYTESDTRVLCSTVEALANFFLGSARSATPTAELIRMLCGFLQSPDDLLCGAAARLLSGMIFIDYITLRVEVVAARNLAQSDRWGLSDPFVRIKICGQSVDTSVRRNTLNPVWNEELVVFISDKSETLCVEMYDWDNAGEELAGSVSFSCDMLEELGNFEGQVAYRRARMKAAEAITSAAESQAVKLEDEGKQRSQAILQEGIDEATRLERELVEEAQFLSHTAEEHAERIMSEAQERAKQLMPMANGKQKKAVDQAVRVEVEKLLKSARQRAEATKAQWQAKAKGTMPDLQGGIAQLRLEASARSEAHRLQALQQAREVLDHAKAQARHIRHEADALASVE